MAEANVCEWSDLPDSWCYHCIHGTTPAETLEISVGDA